ncbi:MAG: hypothetical protein M1553_04875 [Firmicutes bacterium]|nr:hypothetical protein [Bacillota bacterium]
MRRPWFTSLLFLFLILPLLISPVGCFSRAQRKPPLGIIGAMPQVIAFYEKGWGGLSRWFLGGLQSQRRADPDHLPLLAQYRRPG